MAVNTGLELNHLKTLDNFQLWNTYDTLHCEVTTTSQQRLAKDVTAKLGFSYTAAKWIQRKEFPSLLHLLFFFFPQFEAKF